MNLTGITPNLIVTDIERSMAFYRDLLGFSIVTTRSGRRTVCLRLAATRARQRLPQRARRGRGGPAAVGDPEAPAR